MLCMKFDEAALFGKETVYIFEKSSIFEMLKKLSVLHDVFTGINSFLLRNSWMSWESLNLKEAL